MRPGATLRAPKSEAPTGSTLLVCFSHLRWNFVYQRPQHLLTRAARHYRVLFVEEPVYEDRDVAALRRTEAAGGVTVAVPILPHGTGEEEAEAMQMALLGALLASEPAEKLIFWYYTPMALGFSGEQRPNLCIYDCMDELSAFRFAPPKLTERESALFDRADLVFTGGLSLFEAKRGRNPSVHAFPSSIDAAHFATARTHSGPQPHDQSGLPHPRLGYFGVIDERLDLDLIAGMAALRPEWQFVMIGPVVKIDDATLPRAPNVHWLGGKSYGELPDYLAGWDVALMPFALNESTRFISPTKTPEYLAAGVPVVSTPVVDVVRSYGQAGLVEIASTAAEMVASAERLLTSRQPDWLQRVDRHIGNLSWDKTWDGMHELMLAKLGARRRPVRSGNSVAAESAYV
jgi:glycosyltransferase involved in cell wall biosynthesis